MIELLLACADNHNSSKPKHTGTRWDAAQTLGEGATMRARTCRHGHDSAAGTNQERVVEGEGEGEGEAGGVAEGEGEGEAE